MIFRLALAATLASLAVVDPVNAGEVDLVLTASVQPSAPHVPGQTVTVVFTLTNLGPDVAGASAPQNVPLSTVRASTTVRLTDEQRLPISYTPQTPTVCNFEDIPLDPGPGQRAGVIYVVYFPNLVAPGVTYTCSLTALIDPTTTTDFISRWTATSLADQERDPASNSANVVFGLSPVVVDALSLPGMAMLLCGVILIVFARRMGS